MRQNDNLRDKLITYLQDAHAMEHQIEESLENQVKLTEKYPEIQARIQQHLDATRLHEQRMADRLAAYNEKPSALKSVGTNLIGNLIGVTSGVRTDALSKAARDDYMIEHMEIAAYELLIATAQAFGDSETIQACQANMRDEVEMAQWLEQNLPKTVVLSFREDGIALDDAMIPQVEQAALQALQQAKGSLSMSSGRSSGMSSGAMSGGMSNMTSGMSNDGMSNMTSGRSGGVSSMAGSNMGNTMESVGAGVQPSQTSSGLDSSMIGNASPTGDRDAGSSTIGAGHYNSDATANRTSTGAGVAGNANMVSNGMLRDNTASQTGVVGASDTDMTGGPSLDDNPSRTGLVGGGSRREMQSETSLDASGSELMGFNTPENGANENTNPNI